MDLSPKSCRFHHVYADPGFLMTPLMQRSMFAYPLCTSEAEKEPPSQRRTRGINNNPHEHEIQTWNTNVRIETQSRGKHFFKPYMRVSYVLLWLQCLLTCVALIVLCPACVYLNSPYQLQPFMKPPHGWISAVSLLHIKRQMYWYW